ncbi:reverse transcriptase [Phytophthora megakarya]|uniref:Reverse transcriptase n=1 Tax=Phytophthora megakarya TaxID=4795 RepID=A0A225V8Q1_9STRA|nr:reverse transcriptase [Phytophthora megakarya]
MEIKTPLTPAVERPKYETQRDTPKAEDNVDPSPSDKSPSEIQPLDLASVASEESDMSSIADEDSISYAVTVKEALEDLNQATPDVWATDPSFWDGTCDRKMAVLPEVPVTTKDVKIEDIQLCGSDNQTPEEIDRLRQTIWKFRHLLIGKVNALPPATRGVVCDIDVGGARPIALTCRKLRSQFREKLADLIKGLLSAKMINYSRSPWASPIVLNSANELSNALINDLLEDLESTLWYCSLDMWNRMAFGLKNAPQTYQRMIDNALYGFTRIPKSEDHGGTSDVFEDGEPVGPGKPSVLGRSSYIDDILIPANNWDQLCDRVEGLLEACDKLNLSISVVKGFWGMPKVEYLRHKSFLGSLKYYSRFIEDYAIYASALYELREIDFAAMVKEATQARIQQVLEAENGDRGSQEVRSTLKAKIATTPVLRHFDPERRAMVVVYARDWAISGSLMQEYDQINYPVMFASHTLKSNELNYGIAEKEVLAFLRILDLNYNALVGRPIHVREEELYVVSFYGSARVKRGLTVSEAEYHGLLLCLDMLEDLDPRRLVICGDSNLVIRQVRVKVEDKIAQISDVTTRSKARSGVRIGSDPGSLREEVVRELRIERIRQAQDEKSWIMGLKKYLIGEIRDLTQEEAKMFGSIAMNYEVNQLDLLFYCPTTKETAADRDKLMRLVIPESLQQDILHHYHTSLQGGHQGIGRTYDRIRDHFTGEGCTIVYSDM